MFFCSEILFPLKELVRRTGYSAVPLNFRDYALKNHTLNEATKNILKMFKKENVDISLDAKALNEENFNYVLPGIVFGIEPQLSIVGSFYEMGHSIAEKTAEAFGTFDITFWLITFFTLIFLCFFLGWSQKTILQKLNILRHQKRNIRLKTVFYKRNSSTVTASVKTKNALSINPRIKFQLFAMAICSFSKSTVTVSYFDKFLINSS